VFLAAEHQEAWSGWKGRGWGQGGEMTQALYAHMNNKTIKKKKHANACLLKMQILALPKTKSAFLFLAQWLIFTFTNY
jgi:hypothetical protein